MLVCPCCGLPALDVNIRALDYIEASPIQRRVLNELIRLYPRTATQQQILDAVYALDADGGPTYANNIAVHLHRLRPRLRAIGWDVGARGRRAGGIRLWAPHERLTNASRNTDPQAVPLRR